MFVKQVTIGKQVSWTFLGLLEVSVGAVPEISRIALWQCQCLFTMQWIYVSTARKKYICNVFIEMHEQWTKNTIRADPDMPPFLSRDLICKWITCGLMIWCVHCKLHCWHVQPSVCRTLRQWFFAMSNSWVAFSVWNAANKSFAVDCATAPTSIVYLFTSFLGSDVNVETRCIVVRVNIHILICTLNVRETSDDWQTGILNISWASRGFCGGCPWDLENCIVTMSVFVYDAVDLCKYSTKKYM